MAITVAIKGFPSFYFCQMSIHTPRIHLRLNVLVSWLESISVGSVCEVTVFESNDIEAKFNMNNMICSLSFFVAGVETTVLLTVTDMITKYVLIAQRFIGQTVSLIKK